MATAFMFAAPHGPIGHHLAPRPMHRPPPPHHRHHHHSSELFWTGLGTGLLIDAIRPTPPPPVVVGPVITTQRVWVPPVYETRPVLDAYGRVIRYEQVLVRVGYWQ